MTTPPAGWPVLVTGAAGFVGGHVARVLAETGYRVRALTRRAPQPEPNGPPLEWICGDLCDDETLDAATEGVRAVVHCAGWVSLANDREGLSRRVNIDATRSLLDRCERAGVERFLYTSTLWTTAAGTPEHPADETTPWNLGAVRGPYLETKQDAEEQVLRRDRPGFRTTVICPGLVVGTGDRRPTSTGLFLMMARMPMAVMGGGGIPLIDARVLAVAHRRALERGGAGERYIVAGEYHSYAEMARLVGRLTGRPRLTMILPDFAESLLRRIVLTADTLLGGRLGTLELTGAAIAGGFLRLRVTGAKADHEFDLSHPDALVSIYEALDDHRRAGRAPWLKTLHSPDDLPEILPHPAIKPASSR